MAVEEGERKQRLRLPSSTVGVPGAAWCPLPVGSLQPRPPDDVNNQGGGGAAGAEAGHHR